MLVKGAQDVQHSKCGCTQTIPSVRMAINLSPNCISFTRFPRISINSLVISWPSERGMQKENTSFEFLGNVVEISVSNVYINPKRSSNCLNIISFNSYISIAESNLTLNSTVTETYTTAFLGLLGPGSCNLLPISNCIRFFSVKLL